MDGSTTKRYSPMDEPLIPLIGRRIRTEREAAGLTQNDLAKRAGITRVTLSEIENGRREQIKPYVIESIARALDRPARVFFSEASESTEVMDILRHYNLVPQIGVVLLKLVALPPSDQIRVGRLLEQVVLWYESDSSLS